MSNGDKKIHNSKNTFMNEKHASLFLTWRASKFFHGKFRELFIFQPRWRSTGGLNGVRNIGRDYPLLQGSKPAIAGPRIPTQLDTV